MFLQFNRHFKMMRDYSYKYFLSKEFSVGEQQITVRWNLIKTDNLLIENTMRKLVK